MVGEVEVLKTDKRGRVRVPVERREALLDEFEKSGMSGAKFARLAGIKYATFANWTHGAQEGEGQETPSGGPLRLDGGGDGGWRWEGMRAGW